MIVNNPLLLIFFFLLLSLNILAQDPFSGGDGTTANPWQITTIEQLDSVRNYLDSNFVLMNDLDFAGSAYDSAAGWNPIGSESNPFTGTFNGAGHNLKNIFNYRPSTIYNGFFRYTLGAVIDSLGIVNCNVTGGMFTSGLVGNNELSTVSNSFVTGKITGKAATAGLIGHNITSTITNCYTTCTVSGRGYCAGLVGYNYSSSSITNCYATGKVSGSTTGGLVGNNSSSTITNSYYNIESSGQSRGIGKDYYSQTVTGLSISQMKQQSSFTGFDFTSIWSISNGETFPRLQGLYNLPVIIHDISTLATNNVLYTDTIHVVPGDNNVISITLEDAPEGLILEDSIITWIPDSLGRINFSVIAGDASQGIARFIPTVLVMPPGEGTKESPYQISTIDELYAVRYMRNSYYILMNNLDFNGSLYDTAKSTEGWAPISTFTGNFNGRGHTINNLFIKRSSSDNIGLFGKTNGAIIDSLGVINCNIRGGNYTGGLVGYNQSSTLTNCFTTGNISGNKSYYGGLVGFNITSSSIQNCYTSIKVSGYRYIGGLTGNNSGSTITNSYATGTVSGRHYTGGISGNNESSSIISSCYAAINVIGKETHTGGIAGVNTSSKISNCYVTGKVSGYNYTAGLVGRNTSSTIMNCYATGSMFDHGYNYTGALVGYNSSSTITNAYYNTETYNKSTGIGWDNDTSIVAGLTSAQMKQHISFSGFNFDTIWTITNGETFPRLQTVHNVYFVLRDISMSASIDELYTDTIHIIPMDNDNITLTYENLPEGMQIQNSIITWTPDSLGDYSFTITAIEPNGYTIEYNVTIAVVPFYGNGTENSPYQITSIEELDYVRNVPTGHYILMNDLDFSGSNYDITNSTDGWEPISDFTGNFNGAGHTINNLYINRPSSDAGLFDYVESALIDSLGIVNCKITGGDYCTGGLAGNVYLTTLSNCYVSGEILGDRNIGGLVGKTYSSSLKNCYATAEVSGYNNVGGLVGDNYSSTIINCYANSKITGNEYCGGLVGENNTSLLSNCYATGELSGNGYVGGLVGLNSSGEGGSSSITNCYAIAKVSGNEYTGGLVGYNGSSTITNAFYNTEISRQSTGIGEDDNSQSVTGLTTEQMKLQNSFIEFDFDTTWTISNGKTFPRLQSVYNVPVILHDLCMWATTGTLYTDTIHVIPMDNVDISISFESLPEEIQIQDSLITWTPTSGIAYTFHIVATDADQGVSKYQATLVAKPGGDGTEENPFQITTIEELNTVRYLPDSNYILMTDLDFSESVYDSINSKLGWTPINRFTGSFNGAGHTISNLFIYGPFSGSKGLFSFIRNANIDSLGIINCNITGEDAVGSLTGGASESNITNSYATGRVLGSNGESTTGGLIGYFSKSTMTNCYATTEALGSDKTGGLVGFNYSSAISNCYATGMAKGYRRTGGLVGYNYSSSIISNCYATGEVSGSSNTGGFVGINTSSTITNSFFNTETSGLDTVGIGTDNNNQSVTGLTTAQMMQQSSFMGFSFDTVWAIRADSTYPTLQALDNAPFAIPDTITDITASYLFEGFLTNDYDYETLQESLAISVESISSGSIRELTVHLPDTTQVGDEYFVYYKVGEVRANDTLWGNIARSVLVAGVNNAPVLTAVKETSLLEGTSVTFSINDVTASDPDGDVIFLIVYEDENYSLSGNTVTPVADFYGTLTVPVSVTDGRDISNIMNIGLLVNDVPVLTAVNELSTPEDTPITLSMEDVTASDRDGDVLSLIVYEGTNYTVSGTTLSPATGFIGALSVPVAVTDGVDTSNIMNMGITVEEGSGINNALTHNIRMFPNPVKDKITFQGIEGITSIKIININGGVVYTRNISENETIDVSTLPKGVYVVVLRDFGIRKKIIVY